MLGGIASQFLLILTLRTAWQMPSLSIWQWTWRVSDLSDLEGLRDIISKRLMLIDKAYAAQDETMTMLLQDADKMSKEQAALIELRLGTIEAQERVDARVAQKKEEEMAQAQEELRKLKEEQAQQILSQMDAIGLSPEALLELHQKRQKDGKKPIPEDQVF